MNTEVVNTEQEQVNRNISLDNIYKALGYLKPEYQAKILANYKLTELYNILVNDAEYDKYINDLFAVSKEYSDRALALSALHTEALLQGIKKQEKFDVVDSMGKAYEQLPEVDQKKFCKEMFQKKGFFENAYNMMISIFENAAKEQEG